MQGRELLLGVTGGIAAYKAKTYGPLPNNLSGAATEVNTFIAAALYTCP